MNKFPREKENVVHARREPRQASMPGLVALSRRASAGRSGWRAVGGAPSQLLPRRLFAGSAPRLARSSSAGAMLPRAVLGVRSGGAHLRRMSAAPDATAEVPAGLAADSPSVDDSAAAGDASAPSADAAPPVAPEAAAEPASAVGGSGASDNAAGEGPARSAVGYTDEVLLALRAGDHHKVVLLFEGMMSAGIQPEATTFNAFIEAVATSRSVADARLAMAALTAKHPAIIPDVAT